MSGKLMTWEAAVQHLKSQPEQQEIVRQCYYDDPLQVAADRYNRSEEWLAVKLLLDRYRPRKVLDLGAGRISSYGLAQSSSILDSNFSFLAAAHHNTTIPALKTAKWLILMVKTCRNTLDTFNHEYGTLHVIFIKN